jgi:DNA invertase Pin-like site-specific DNA recombinase
MRVIIYARYSSDKQREASLEDQVRNCERYATTKNWEIVDRLRDSALSGAKNDRPQYQRLLAMAQAKAFDILLIDDLSRLSRDQIEIEKLRRMFEYQGIRLIGVSDGIDTANKGHRLQTGVRGLIDEMYLEDLRAKTHRGLYGLALKGFSCGGRTYGYRSVPLEHPTKKDHHGRPALIAVQREIDPDEAPWIQQIFTWYAAGRSPRWIAAELNRQGVPSSRGSTWSASALHGDFERGTGLLNNPLYIGEFIWNRSEWARHPETRRRIRKDRPQEEWVTVPLPDLRIVPQDLWEAVKARQRMQQTKGEAVRQGLKKSSTGGKGHKYLFSGLLKCAQCEGNYVVTTRYQYGCSTRINRGTVVCDNAIRVSRELLERTLLARIKQDLLCPEGIELFLKETQRLMNQQPSPTQDLGKQLQQIEKEIQNLLNAIKKGLLTESTGAELRRLEAKKKELESLLHEKNGVSLNGHQFIPTARACFQNLVNNLENVEAACLPPIREQIKTLVGGQIKLHPTDQGYLEAELAGDYAGFLKLTGEKSKIMVVAGACNYR